MTRYQVLRSIGCDPVTSAFVSALNWMVDVPAGEIRLLHMTIEYDHDQQDH